MTNTIDNWVDDVIQFWKSKNIELESGTSLNAFTEAEKTVGLSFPLAFKELYKKVNGFKNSDWNEHMFSIWPLEKIIEEYNFGINVNFVAFSDYLINSHWIGFVKGAPGVFKQYNLKAVSTPTKIADSFEDAINMINSNHNIIY